MATLANLVKNINPPRQMTWAVYNALPTQVKNDGTQYYITDRDDAVQTAATTAALDKNGSSSNVQAELDSLNTAASNLLDGTAQAHTAQYLYAPNERGVHTDQYGRIFHNDKYETATWEIVNNAQNFRALQIRMQNGQMRSGNRTFCSGIGDTFSSTYICGGMLSNSSKDLAFSVPCYTCGKTATLTELDVVVRSTEGQYPYMKYGSNASSSIQLGSGNTTIWENSTEKYANSINYITLSAANPYIIIFIRFINPLVTTSGGSTSIKTLTPISIYAVPTFTFS